VYLAKATIKELNIAQEILDQCEHVMSSTKSPLFKKNQLRDLLGVTFCSSCQGIPSLEICYSIGNITRIEHYCKTCYEKSLEREKKEPSDRSGVSLAEFYGCQKI
jgi:hypothetical protein